MDTTCRGAGARRGFFPGLALGSSLIFCVFLATRPSASSKKVATALDSAPATPDEAAGWLGKVLRAWSRSCDPPGLVASKCSLVAAVIDGDSVSFSRTVAGESKASLLSPSSPFVHQLHEIASITKVFTALVLARLSAIPGSGVTLTTTVGDLFSALQSREAQMVDPRVLRVSLEELASHTGGMPRMPPGMHGTARNPFTGYSDGDLLAALLQLRLTAHYGSFVYSNFGFGLLGRLLGVRSHQRQICACPRACRCAT